MTRISLIALSCALFTSTALAQSNQGVLATGNLVGCARTCGVFSESASTCGGGSSSSQAIWACFCQRVYSTSAALITSGTGLCSDTCTSSADQSSAIQWFGAECGSDNGASEHPDTGSGSGSGSGGTSTTTTAASSSATTDAAGSSSSGTSSGDGNGITGTNPPTGDWWSNHWKWIVMLIVLAVGLSIFAAVAVWLKKRHDRKQDKVTSGFNAGITSRSANPQMRGPIDRMSDIPRQGPYANEDASGSFADASHAGPGLEAGSGRASPARTRDAFMPYGYGYTRSESKLSGRGNVASPEPEMGSADEISRVGDGQPGSVPKKGGRRIMVRERSG